MRPRRVLRPLAAALLILAAVPALLLWMLLFAPQRILTSRTVGLAIQIFGSAYQPQWSRFDFGIGSLDVLDKEISISAADVCFEKAGGGLSGCFKSLEARFIVEISPTRLRVTKLVVLDAEGESLRVVEAAGEREPASKTSFNPIHLPRLLPSSLLGLRIEKASVNLPSVEIERPGAKTKGALRASYDPSLAAPLALDAKWEERSRGGVHRGRARLNVASDFFKSGRLTRAAVRGSFRAEGASGEISANARRTGADAVAVDAEASVVRDGLRFRFQGTGVQTTASYALKGGLAVEASTGPLAGLRLEPFTLTAARRNGEAVPVSLHLESGLAAEQTFLRPVRGFNPPRVLGGRLILNARASPTPSQEDHFDADLSILLNPYLSWYEAHVDLFARASGRIGDLAHARISQRIDANVTIARFEDLAAFLAGGPFAVPAPLVALKGGLRASLSARGEPGSDRVDFDCQARGDLAGDKQKLKFHVAGGGAATGLMTKDRAISVRAAATLDDVALQLPHLDVLKMPKVRLDPRIKNTAPGPAPARAAGGSPDAEVSRSTPVVAAQLTLGTSQPLVLYTDLAKTPVPIALDLKIDEPPGILSGSVQLKSFDVEFFRRNAAVDHITLKLRPGSKLTDLDGLIKYQATDALIRIRLLGTTDRPQVVFESDPPLTENEIIALLVFGKSPNDLDADQNTTVANTQSAMSNNAFGLASLYLFASTPIQFVGYDPAAKSYTMKVRIPGGEIVSFNSDFQATNSVQLRKRLSRRFAIVTEAVNSPTQGNSVVTFLEWFTRY